MSRKPVQEELSLEQLLNNDELLERLSPQKRPGSTIVAKKPQHAQAQLADKRSAGKGDATAALLSKAKKILSDSEGKYLEIAALQLPHNLL